ncbi:MAG: type I phosphomannose isomerase catalytic subunit, partial [Chloroflexota bacterium]
MMNNIYPLLFTPVFRDYIWGGRNLETKFGRTIPPGLVAESWEISGHPSSPTTVENGPFAGKTLPDLLTLLQEELVGHRAKPMLARGKFPLLIKLLDANQPLSVQVHPEDSYAQVHENGELGKTEMWYILHAEPDASLIFGLKPGVTPASFRQAIEAGTLETCLHYLPVKAGDAIFIPAGSVHAIMDGIILAEIQQNSDTTYRVYDWNRVGADGKPRQLHVDRALDVINFNQVEPTAFAPQLIEETDNLRREIITKCPL